jgi:anti-sigma regulatory factor (Ser/Thr protein kinase)
MRTGAPAGRAGYFHEAVNYASAEELLAVVLPFLRGGVESGEPTVVALCETNAALVREALGYDTPVIFQAGGDLYARPAGAIRAYRELFADYTASGAHQIRVIGELPAEALGVTWDWWARYESAINEAYDEFPLWSMCAYDTRITPPDVLADVARTHPNVALPGDAHVTSAGYVEPALYLRQDRPMVPDPLQLARPVAELTDPSPGAARAALARVGEGVLDGGALSDMRIAITEAVTNATTHGVRPAVVRFWAGPDRVVVSVTDGGKGPTDPFAGLRAAAHAPAGGLGLWLTHLLCDHVAMSRTAEGFTIRMISGDPHHRAQPGGAPPGD